MNWARCDPPPETPWESCGPSSTPTNDVRERLEDFNTPTHELDGASIERRPDAIALDYWTAHTLGPVREGDTSEGLVAWTWRARTLDGYTVTLTRETETRDGWEPNGAVFTITDGGPPIIELDVAFEQTGNAVICASRATGPDGGEEVWIYFYDPTVPGYVFRNFGPGRTPRALLDRPLEIADSDVLVFYISDEAGRIVYRQQRDRYQAEIATPAAVDENMFVEDAVKLADRRVAVIYTVRDPETGTYSEPLLMVSSLPPYVMDAAAAASDLRVSRISLDLAIKYALDARPEGATAGSSVSSIILAEPVIVFDDLQPDGATAKSGVTFIGLESTVVEWVMKRAGAATASTGIVDVFFDLIITIDREMEVSAASATCGISTILLEAA